MCLHLLKVTHIWRLHSHLLKRCLHLNPSAHIYGIWLPAPNNQSEQQFDTNESRTIMEAAAFRAILRSAQNNVAILRQRMKKRGLIKAWAKPIAASWVQQWTRERTGGTVLLGPGTRKGGSAAFICTEQQNKGPSSLFHCLLRREMHWQISSSYLIYFHMWLLFFPSLYIHATDPDCTTWQ